MNRLMDKVAVVIGLIFILIGILGITHKSDVEVMNKKDATEEKFYSIKSEDVKEIQCYILSDDKTVIIIDKNKIKMLLDIFKYATYGMANHPSAENSSHIYIDIIGDSNDSLYSLYSRIMKEGFDSDTVYYYIKNEDTYRYKSPELYDFFVKEKLYSDTKRTFTLE